MNTQAHLKNRIRAEMLDKRRTLEPDAAAQRSRPILTALLATDAFKTARFVLAYLPLRGEVRTQGILEACRQAGKQVFVPAWRARTGQYEPARLDAGTPCTRGEHGVQEPKGKKWAPIATIDLALVPGLAFDTAGHRLGRGGGHYDRMLKHCAGVTIGLAFHFQMLTLVPAEPHDVRMDAVITEQAVRNCSHRVSASGTARTDLNAAHTDVHPHGYAIR